MRSVDEFLRSLFHQDMARSDVETPAQRHARYLRERELKGRTSGSPTPAPAHRPSAPIAKTPKKPAPKQAPVDPAQKRAATEARTKEMETRLDTLRELLKKLVDQAQERSGVDQPADSKPTKTASSSDKKKLTEAEKADAAKKAEEWRKKNPDKVLDQQVKRLETQIKNVEDKIKEMRDKLKQSPVPRPIRKPGSDKVGNNPLPRR